MLDDLKLDRDKFDGYVCDLVANNNVGITLSIALKKFEEKVISRRAQVKKYETELENKDINPGRKEHHLAFIKKVALIEKNYLSERQFVIRRAVKDSLENMTTDIWKKLLG